VDYEVMTLDDNNAWILDCGGHFSLEVSTQAEDLKQSPPNEI